ncbi:MAG: zinc metallopeptidase [Bacteroides sp.]|nr:zinc metallopeptidase [Bacteroides sp.]MCM1085474.1 zinc metallopeptidase [Bacteroides sp.]MCM1169683.1 zinc metallopeptidase [Bacteroides sp.]
MSFAWLIFIGLMVLGLIVQSNLKNKFRKYSKVPLPGGMTGKDVAEKMLRDHGITDVTVQCVPGMLSDHYNPDKQTVNLSRDVFYGDSIAAAAVAAHECGHAVQHATAYSWLRMRSALVPVVSYSDRIVMWVLLAGVLLVETTPSLLLFGICLFALTTLFAFITLPVEIDASRRAVAWLDTAQITNAETYPMACSALRSAAYTYVIAALSSLATLLYYIMIYLNRRD